MTNFINKYRNKLVGALSGFDRIVFRGVFRNLLYSAGMASYLNFKGILLKDFDAFVYAQTDYLRTSLYKHVENMKRPIIYLESSNIRKEKKVQEILHKNPVNTGLICLLTCVEPCMSYQIYKNPQTHKLELKSRIRKCLFLYFYYQHEEYGLMHIRLQTWFPFTIQICMNGREWLSRQMDSVGISYEKDDNCFIRIADSAKANALLQEQVKRDWPKSLDDIISFILKPMTSIVGNAQYYWTLHQSEWATDLMFESVHDLQEIYPHLVRGSLICFSSDDIMRFLGNKKLHGNYKGEVIGYYKKRPEGIRIKYNVDGNFLKMYDKKGIILRVETVINNPYFFKVFREKEGSSSNECSWKLLRKGVADIKRRTEISQKSNERYLESLASIDTGKPIKEIVDGICVPAYLNNKRVRAFRPWSKDDNELLKSICDGRFVLNGFRNKDLRERLYSEDENSNLLLKKKLSQAITRKIRLLRAHGLLKKIPKTSRYMVTDNGRKIISAILGYQNIALDKIFNFAA